MAYKSTVNEQSLKENTAKLIKKAEAGDNSAKILAGICYKNGWGTKIDEAKAVEYFEEAAEAPKFEVDALYQLGLCYKTGSGVDKNTEVAADFFLEAANLNHANAQFAVGLCLQTGSGVAKDNIGAISWHLKAKNNGVVEASKKIKEIVSKTDYKKRLINDINKQQLSLEEHEHSLIPIDAPDYEGTIAVENFETALTIARGEKDVGFYNAILEPYSYLMQSTLKKVNEGEAMLEQHGLTNLLHAIKVEKKLLGFKPNKASLQNIASDKFPVYQSHRTLLQSLINLQIFMNRSKHINFKLEKYINEKHSDLFKCLVDAMTVDSTELDALENSLTETPKGNRKDFNFSFQKYIDELTEHMPGKSTFNKLCRDLIKKFKSSPIGSRVFLRDYIVKHKLGSDFELGEIKQPRPKSGV